MRYDSWTCLMVGKGMGMVNDSVRSLLKASASNMYLQNKLERMTLRSTICDGVLETEWKTFVVGTRGGVLFRARTEMESGECRINFLLHTKDLERGSQIIKEIEEEHGAEWSLVFERFPVEELYQFDDLRRLH